MSKYLDAALEFRGCWPSALRSETLIQYVMAIENRLRLMGNRTALIPGRMAAAIVEHKKLMKAIEAGDPEAAERLERGTRIRAHSC